MSLNTLNKNNKNISITNYNSNSTEKNTFKKLSQNYEKNNNDYNINKKSIYKSNSQIYSNFKNLTDKKQTSKNSNKTINSNLINKDIDNIDISNYNPDLYIIPKKKYKHNLYITKLEETIYNYNNIKVNLNKKISNDKIPNNTKSLQMKNLSLLNGLDDLNIILDTLVERKRFSTKKQKDSMDEKINELKNKENTQYIKLSSKDINKKLLENIMKQNIILSEKYQKLSNEDYILKIKEQIESISLEISDLEKSNKDLKKIKIMNEYELNKINIPKNDLKYKNKIEQQEHLDKEYSKLMKTIATIEDTIKNNEKKIELLNENKNKLIIKAKEEYNIENPEVKNIQKKEKNLNEKRKNELERKNKTLINNIKKYNYQIIDNERDIKKINEEITNANSQLKEKKELLNLLNKKFNELEKEYYNFNNNDNNNLKQENNKNINFNNDKINKNNKGNEYNDINKNVSFISQSQVSPIKPIEANTPEINDNKIVSIINDINDNKNKKVSLNRNNKSQILENINIKDNTKINDRYNIISKNPNNNRTYNKKMILEQLDMQNNQVKLDKSINLKKNKLKPNFSFSLNDINLKSKKVNLSVAIVPKTKINEEKNNEIVGEIKEDIELNNINEEKSNSENKNKKIFINLSQNISLENNENEEEKIRENDLNTVPYNELEGEQKYINSYDKDEINLNDNYINSNEQEHIFENDQVGLEDNI